MGVTCYYIPTSFEDYTFKLFPLLPIPFDLDILPGFNLKVTSAEKYSLILCRSSEYLVKLMVLYTLRPSYINLMLFWNEIHR